VADSARLRRYPQQRGTRVLTALTGTPALRANTEWAQQNLDRLCDGASEPAEPPRCFTDHPSNYADATIACFQTRLRAENRHADLKVSAQYSVTRVNLG
jgi:hypothetical protein